MTGAPVDEVVRLDVCPPVVRWSAAAFGAATQVVLWMVVPWVVVDLTGSLGDTR